MSTTRARWRRRSPASASRREELGDALAAVGERGDQDVDRDSDRDDEPCEAPPAAAALVALLLGLELGRQLGFGDGLLRVGLELGLLDRDRLRCVDVLGLLDPRRWIDGAALEVEQARPAPARATRVGDGLVHRAALGATPGRVSHGERVRRAAVYEDVVRGIRASWIRDPSSAEFSYTTRVAASSKSCVVKSNVPRVPVPEVAVTKFLSTTFPSASSSSYWKVASNVFAVPVARSGLDTWANGSGDSTRISGVSSSKSARV